VKNADDNQPTAARTEPEAIAVRSVQEQDEARTTPAELLLVVHTGNS
jgi:hypothetical protein